MTYGLDFKGQMTTSIRTSLRLFMVALCACAVDALPASAGEERTAAQRAAELPISGPRRTGTTPRAGAIPVEGARVPRPTTAAPQPKAAARTPSRWPTNAKPFVSSRPSTTPPRTAVAPAPRSAPAPRATRNLPSGQWRPVETARRPISRPAPARTASRAPATNANLPSPQVRRSSPSYAELERSRAGSRLARPAYESTSTYVRPTRRATSRRSTPARRASSPRRPASSLTVPLAPGQQAPQPPTRRQLDFRPPPGCTCYG